MRCIHKHLSFDLEYTDYSELFCKSNYVLPGCQNLFNKKKKNDLALVHFNSRSLQKHIDELNDYLAGLNIKPEIIALAEALLQEGKIHSNSDLNGYHFVHTDSIINTEGVGLYIHETLKYRVNSLSNVKLPNAEHLWIDIQTNQGWFIVGVVYRHPLNTTKFFNNFNEKYNELHISIKYP